MKFNVNPPESRRARARSPFNFRRAALTVKFYSLPRIFIREQGRFAAAAARRSPSIPPPSRRKVPRSTIAAPAKVQAPEEGAMAVLVNGQLATHVVH